MGPHPPPRMDTLWGPRAGPEDVSALWKRPQLSATVALTSVGLGGPGTLRDATGP